MPRSPGSLSFQLLQWLDERVEEFDEIRIRSLDHRHLESTLGTGRFGYVRKYVNQTTGRPEAGKVINLEMFDHGIQSERRVSERLDVFLRELRRLQKISKVNDRIADFLGFYADSSTFILMTEFVTNGSVKDRLNRGSIPEPVVEKYFSETVEALHYLHTLPDPIVHSDIKANNLMITNNDSIKLTNFGLVRDLAVDGFGLNVASDISLDFRGTLLYVAPEVLNSPLGPGNRKSYGMPADIWALGCTLIEMMVGAPPHFEYYGKVGEVDRKIVQDDLPYSSDVFVPSASDRFKDIVDHIFVRDPEERPTTSQLRKLLGKPSTSSSHDDLYLEAPSRSHLYQDAPSFNNNHNNRYDDKISSLNEFTPLETIENGVIRRKRGDRVRPKKERKKSPLAAALLHYLSRAVFFGGILSKSILYMLIFLIIGLSTLAFFLFVAYLIVSFCRYLIQLRCDECDLDQPQYLVISGILLILIFALLFSCCMVAVGEYKFRVTSDRRLLPMRLLERPSRDVRICGIRLLRRKIEHPNDLSLPQD